MNISREHNSNTIYFMIFISGNSIKITQRCHCSCLQPHEGANVLCKSYSSNPIDIKSNTELYKLLMPPKTSNSIGNLDNYEATVSNTLNINFVDSSNKGILLDRITKIENNDNSLFDDECLSEFMKAPTEPTEMTDNLDSGGFLKRRKNGVGRNNRIS